VYYVPHPMATSPCSNQVR